MLKVRLPNFNTMKKAEAMTKTDFWHTEAFRTLRSHQSATLDLKPQSDENLDLKGLSVPKICLFL